VRRHWAMSPEGALPLFWVTAVTMDAIIVRFDSLR
jgi:hypothetical protein